MTQRSNPIQFIAGLVVVACLSSAFLAHAQSKRADGYTGIWFTLGQKSEYGDKYSGGLGTYTTSHVPMAIFAPKVNKTFFVYGGTIPGKRHLLAMISCYDHATGTVPKPVIVHDKNGVDDPHDDPSLCIDPEGYVWVFVAGRANVRPGFIYRSVKPYDIDAFEQIQKFDRMAYPQPWWIEGKGFFFLFTMYTKGREEYWMTSPDGRKWSEIHKLVGFGGHYQTSALRNGEIITAFNYHPGGNVDKRTNLYLLRTKDLGKTWTNAAGEVIQPPLAEKINPALVYNYEAEKKNIYIQDVTFDADGQPVIMFNISTGHQPGPQDPPRTWHIARFKAKEKAWEIHPITTSTHSYDVGALYIEADGTWRIIGPTEAGPQRWGTGGEMAMWTSADQGKTWTKIKQLTDKSPRNHSYARRPINARDDFYAFWADGDADKFSESILYFCTKDGQVFALPQKMTGDTAKPEKR